MEIKPVDALQPTFLLEDRRRDFERYNILRLEQRFAITSFRCMLGLLEEIKKLRSDAFR